jgi:hypothetical protein
MFKTTSLVLMAFLVAVVVSSPVQAVVTPYLVDSLAQGHILDPWFTTTTSDGRWHDERGDGGYIFESSMSAPGAATQDGSMGIDYSAEPPAWDREMRGYFSVDPDFPQYLWPLPDLTGLSFTWWEYKGNVAGEPNFALVDEHVQQFQIYSPDGRAFLEVPHATEVGWRLVVTPPLTGIPGDGWTYEGINFDLAAVDTLNFWTSAWDNNEGNVVLVDDIWLIPEPATMMLLGLGGLMTLLRRRKA